MLLVPYKSLRISINRIRLEFKGKTDYIRSVSGISVLIESDWNLKFFILQFLLMYRAGINRIRLEFKVVKCRYSSLLAFRINRIRLEFKEKNAATSAAEVKRY